MSLSLLPTELLESIVEHLTVSYHISSLSRTCRRHHQIITPTLYRRDGSFAVLWAAGNSRPETLRQCLKFCPEAVEFSHLGTAAANKSPSVVDILLEFPQVREAFLAGKWDDSGSTPLGEAATEGCIDSLRSLLAVPSTDANILDIVEWSPLELAVWSGNWECAYILLQHGAIPTPGPAKERTCLVQAITEKAPMYLIRALLDADIEADTDEGVLPVAAEHGNLEMVKMLLVRGVPVNGTDTATDHGPSNTTRLAYYAPLYAAGECSESQVEIVKALLDAGADINKTSGYWKASVLHSFATTASIEVTKMLLNHGASAQLNIKDNRGRLPLHYAAVADNFDVAKMLIDLGARVDVTDNTGYTPLHLCKSAAVGQLLIDAGADVKVVDISMIYRPGYTKDYCEADESLLVLLLQNRPDIGPDAEQSTVEEGMNVVISAMKKGHTVVLRELFHRGLPTFEDMGPKDDIMIFALAEDQSGTFQFLMDRAAQLNIELDYLRMLEVFWYNSNMATYNVDRFYLPQIVLQQPQPTETSQGFLTSLLYRRPLHPDKRKEKEDDGEVPTDILQTIIDKGFDLNAMDSDGRRPLNVACVHPTRHANRVRLLLENGADPNLIDQKGNTAILVAAGEGHLAALERLIAHGADVNAKTKGGQTALMKAVQRTHEMDFEFVKVGRRMGTSGEEVLRVEVCKVLVASGVDINAVDDKGKSALDHCLGHSMSPKSRLAKYLVRAGCAPRIKHL